MTNFRVVEDRLVRAGTLPKRAGLELASTVDSKSQWSLSGRGDHRRACFLVGEAEPGSIRDGNVVDELGAVF
ncbi:hypothetical protein [Amycolatopsis sp. lyj-90]|uniref:hypothetical protein n=1 Tax=Amycolatopsis sp. lyj-90 TaxID=2789285 RepID=UPI00397B1C09